MTTDLQENAVDVKNGNETSNTPTSELTPVAEQESVPFVRRVVENVERTLDEWQRWGWPVPPTLHLPRILWSREGADWMPQIEVAQNNGNLIVRVELPGMKREEINVEVSSGTLIISGKREEKKEEKENGYFRSERSYGKFFRSIPLPEGVSGEEAKAEFRDGLLEITIPVSALPENRKKIEVA